MLTEMSATSVGDDAIDGEKATTMLLASPQSFCAGAQRAIQTVEQILKRAAGPGYVRKQIVHNTVAVAELRFRGEIFVGDLGDIPDPAPLGATAACSAHGVSPAVRGTANQHGLQVVDATCSLVTKVRSEAARFAARGETRWC